VNDRQHDGSAPLAAVDGDALPAGIGTTRKRKPPRKPVLIDGETGEVTAGAGKAGRLRTPLHTKTARRREACRVYRDMRAGRVPTADGMRLIAALDTIDAMEERDDRAQIDALKAEARELLARLYSRALPQGNTP
jgi:hypothetical protein